MTPRPNRDAAPHPVYIRSVSVVHTFLGIEYGFEEVHGSLQSNTRSAAGSFVLADFENHCSCTRRGGKGSGSHQ